MQMTYRGLRARREVQRRRELRAAVIIQQAFR